MKKYILSGILSVLVMSGLLITVKSLAYDVKESIEGEGILVNEDGSRNQFSFNVKRNPNGKVTGQATLRNPSFRAVNGQNDQIKIDVTCIQVIGNIAVLGGTTKRKNSQVNAEAVYFAVEDNGSPGTGMDKIFRGFFYDDDPATKGDPQVCKSLELAELPPLEPIVTGNIQVKVE